MSEGFTQEMLQVVEATEIKESISNTPVTHAIQIIRQDDEVSSFLQVATGATAGSITVAEAKLGSMVPPICINTCIGTRIHSADVTKPYQQVFLKEMAKYGSGRTHEAINMPLELLRQEGVKRLSLLYQQEGFVANDEMEHYLKMLTATQQATHAPAVLIPECYEDDELVLLIKNWFAQALLVADAPCTIVTAIYAHFHWFPVGIKFAHGKIEVFTTPGERIGSRLPPKTWVTCAPFAPLTSQAASPMIVDSSVLGGS